MFKGRLLSHVLFFKIRSATDRLPQTVFSEAVVFIILFLFCIRSQIKGNPGPLVVARAIHAHLKTAKEKNCCQFYVHSVKNISV